MREKQSRTRRNIAKFIYSNFRDLLPEFRNLEIENMYNNLKREYKIRKKEWVD